MMRVLSLGAGVQSSTLAYMTTWRGRDSVPRCDHAIFADTGAEPKSVYSQLYRLQRDLEPRTRVHIVMHKEGLTKQLEKAAKAEEKSPNPPFFAISEKGIGQLQRQCTSDFKINPINKFVRQLLGLKARERVPKGTQVEMLIGISVDEVYRVRQNKLPWIKNVYPLIDLRMTRQDCLNWMERQGLPAPPRSACVYCPYKSDHEWRLLRDNDPEGWAEAQRVDGFIRSGLNLRNRGLFVHRSCKPLAEVDLATAENMGQINMFNNECEGMCGV